MHISSVMLGNQHHYMPVVLLTHPRALDPTGSHVPSVGAPGLWQIILAQNSCWENQRQQIGSGQLHTPLQSWPSFVYLQSTAMHSKAQAEHRHHAEKQNFHRWQKLLQAYLELIAYFGR